MGVGKGATLDAGYKVTGWRDGGAPGKPFVADIPASDKLSQCVLSSMALFLFLVRLQIVP